MLVSLEAVGWGCMGQDASQRCSLVLSIDEGKAKGLTDGEERGGSER